MYSKAFDFLGKIHISKLFCMVVLFMQHYKKTQCLPFNKAILKDIERAIILVPLIMTLSRGCYAIKPVRKAEGKFYWKIPLGNDDATREK